MTLGMSWAAAGGASGRPEEDAEEDPGGDSDDADEGAGGAGAGGRLTEEASLPAGGRGGGVNLHVWLHVDVASVLSDAVHAICNLAYTKAHRPRLLAEGCCEALTPLASAGASAVEVDLRVVDNARAALMMLGVTPPPVEDVASGHGGATDTRLGGAPAEGDEEDPNQYDCFLSHRQKDAKDFARYARRGPGAMGDRTGMGTGAEPHVPPPA